VVSSLIQTFERDGIRFQHPATWTLEMEDNEDGGWSATVQSPETAFLLVSLRPDADDPAQLADQTLEALKLDYKELDAANAVETLAGQVAIGHDIDFLTLDTTIACCTRCLQSPSGPFLIMCQVSEYDRERQEPVLRAICASLTAEEE
jgi:hypothetical protein